MENHKVNSNEMLLNEADFMLAVLQTYADIAYLKEKHRKLYSDQMQFQMLNQLVKLESFIDENKVDWEQLYNICLHLLRFLLDMLLRVQHELVLDILCCNQQDHLQNHHKR